ncbi:MAG TPA: hypothetical protein VIK18_06235, partial [Pirellulales bacterium]
MSEFQSVAFRAIDGPVSNEDLEFMRQQSSRAEITPWSFDNGYRYGDFRGDAAEMLRRGYDFHLHYANFGIRTLMIRLPNGLPDAKAAQRYFEQDSLELLKDKRGPGRILRIRPYLEPGELDDPGESEDLVERLLPLRAEIIDGDLRPLYLAHLAVAYDSNHDRDEEHEAPVPAGLDQLTDAQQALAELYGLSEALIAAAAQNSPPLPNRTDPKDDYAVWLASQPEATKNAWLAQLMADSHTAVRREILAEFQKSHRVSGWPVTRSGRTIAELDAAAEVVELEL